LRTAPRTSETCTRAGLGAACYLTALQRG